MVKSQPSQLTQNMKSLSGLKEVIRAKTQCLSEMISIKGKLDMLKTTYAMQDPSQKFMKIKNNLKKQNLEEGNLLVYQD